MVHRSLLRKEFIGIPKNMNMNTGGIPLTLVKYGNHSNITFFVRLTLGVSFKDFLRAMILICSRMRALIIKVNESHSDSSDTASNVLNFLKNVIERKIFVLYVFSF